MLVAGSVIKTLLSWEGTFQVDMIEHDMYCDILPAYVLCDSKVRQFQLIPFPLVDFFIPRKACRDRSQYGMRSGCTVCSKQ